MEEKGRPLLNYLIKTHKQRGFRINYFVFEGVFNCTRGMYEDAGVILHDCVSELVTIQDFKKRIIEVSDGGIVVIDSLSNALILYGVREVYRILHEICTNKGKSFFPMCAISAKKCLNCRKQAADRFVALGRIGRGSENGSVLRTPSNV